MKHEELVRRFTHAPKQRGDKLWVDVSETDITDADLIAVLADASKRCDLTSVQILKLRNTNVKNTGIQAIAERCRGLEYLNVSGTQITDAAVKAIVTQLTKLKYLSLHRCPGLQLPRELIADYLIVAGLQAYFAREQEEKRQLNEAKVIVVGNEAVGKSALVKYLVKGEPCGETKKTPGIDIHDKIDVSKWNPGAGELWLNVWDFGGQEVLTETHKLFLTARALYLVVLEARRENTADAELELHHWMRAIRNRSGEPVPVIVVVNKADTGHGLRLDESRLEKEYGIVSFIRTSCLDPAKHPGEGGKGIEQLKQTILDTVHNHIPQARAWFPLSYYRVKEELERLASAEFILSPGRFATLCTPNGINTETEQEILLTLLNDIGVVVRHKSNSLLDPNWLTTAIYRILTHSDVVKANGEFAANDLGKLLKDIEGAGIKYPSHRWQYIVEQTVACGLSFELPGQPGQYLMPEQLPPNDPERNWPESECFRFRYDYDGLPKGLLPRFIVEMHQYLTEERTAWANGVVLRIGQCRVLVRADRKNRRVLLFVDGPKAERREAAFLVREGLARVHTRFEELKPKPMVPVEVSGDSDAAIEYEQLVEFERQGLTEYAFKGKKFDVSELLSGIGREPVIRRAEDDPFTRLVTGSPPPPPSPEPPATPWWQPLFAPGVAAAVVGVLATLYLAGVNWQVVSVIALVALTFAVVLLVKSWTQWRSDHWPKPMMHACLAVAGLSAALPAVRFVVDVKEQGKLEWFLDNSPWAAIPFILGVIALSVIQVVREQRK